MVGHQPRDDEQKVAEELVICRYEWFLSFPSFQTLIFHKPLIGHTALRRIYVVKNRMRELDNLPLDQQQNREQHVNGKILHRIRKAVMKIAGQYCKQIALVLIKARVVHIAQSEQLVHSRAYLRDNTVSLAFVLLFAIFWRPWSHLHMLVLDHLHIFHEEAVLNLFLNQFLLVVIGAVLFVAVPKHPEMLFLSDEANPFTPLVEHRTHGQ
jgi:hypothetical protein